MKAMPMTPPRRQNGALKETLQRWSTTFAAKVLFAESPQTTVCVPATSDENARQWVRAIMLTALFVGLYFFLTTHAFAADGDEFKDAADKFEGWVKGNLGKLAAFVALGVGSVVAAVKKDWSWFFGAVVLAMGIGIIAGIVNASFTATI